jgi:putative NIF3 family GTP cyclohydrolase 1 type 2
MKAVAAKAQETGAGVLRARDVAAYVEELAPVDSGVPRDDNRFTFGDPDQPARGVGTTWMATTAALDEAAASGLNLLVVHEAWWFEEQHSPWYRELPAWSKPVNQARLQRLVAHGICLYRCHSNWDARPGDGVADQIGPALGLEQEVARGRFTRVFEIEPTTLAGLATRVKERLELPAVRVFGDLDQPVRRVAPLIGGFGGNQSSIPEEVYRLGAEAVVTGELTEYINLHAQELGMGVVETLHSATENPAMRRLAALLRARFPQVPVRYIESGARRRLHVV